MHSDLQKLLQEYLNEILIHWDITEKEADVIADAVKIGLEDAAVRGECRLCRAPDDTVLATLQCLISSRADIDLSSLL